MIILHRDIELNTPRARIIELLKEKAIVKEDSSIHVYMTQNEIAGETGTTRETVNRFLNELVKMGLIRTGRGYLQIIIFYALENM